MTEEKQPKSIRAVFAEMLGADAPVKVGLGGWGIPGLESGKGPQPNLGMVVGYCLEKIAIQFRTLRGISVESAELQRSLSAMAGGKLGARIGQSGTTFTKKQKEAREAAALALSDYQENKEKGLKTIRGLAGLSEPMRELGPKEKCPMIEILVANLPEERHSLLHTALLNILRSATNTDEFTQLLQAGGGKDALKDKLFDADHGAYLALLQDFGQDEWTIPLHHPLFSDPDAANNPHSTFEGLKAQFGQTQQEGLFTEDGIERFISGDINAAELLGLSREELYLIANRGYELIDQGKLPMALRVFEGLSYLDPTDAYFYTVLGSIRQRMEELDSALACYDVGIRLQGWNLAAYANRGEIFFNQGRLTDALIDFQRVLALDPDAKSPSTLRVHTLISAIQSAMDKLTEEPKPIES
jgi:tetratricopeptide (TPR) repeat protein